jgi:Cof subfamily protein (haloacid dehalogenase superfamily)
MLNFNMAPLPIRLLAVDIDGTLLNHEFKVSPEDAAAMRQAHAMGVEIVIATGRRHQFALHVAEELGVDLCMISSNGAVTRSLSGERFHRNLLPKAVCRQLCLAMDAFRGHMVVTFDKETKGALVLEHLEEIGLSIRRWLEKNLDYIEFVIPIENALVEDPIQAMFCGTLAKMREARQTLEASGLLDRVTVLRTEYPERDLSMVDILNYGCTKGQALRRWAEHRGIPREQVMAIGDNYNDVEMLEYAGIPVIMGNAPEDLRNRNHGNPDLGKRGWMETRPNSENGVAAALEEVLFRHALA